jgi:hypothetical protein
VAPLGGHLGAGLYPTPLRALSEDASPPPPHGASILLEGGNYLLLESGDTILLE